ncbi:unnamed protein product [Vitrella brassicaformis CCMP3155]|uniref:proline--tRNA ligase n=3 Tax=Vitrella brassicaformis TaxID=1169539 RepID=A0A0G4EV72_VITBC|nr:unnamed protein product [Vitrella brassicaformis CCMP3155]|mmetsp:Transcript_21105/g.60299  ORF Transcript_21105/g.60299 Transcript_21105/m.60299 type:complete len:691 (-) Transcript_21105:157-2229(-)|eukprot:CEM01959.1 unnamed protein product [Vitrella brassicaformis CCMP3155]
MTHQRRRLQHLLILLVAFVASALQISLDLPSSIHSSLLRLGYIQPSDGLSSLRGSAWWPSVKRRARKASRSEGRLSSVAVNQDVVSSAVAEEEAAASRTDQPSSPSANGKGWRTSGYPLHTLKEDPADAEIASHRLMIKAGMIRRLASGVYSWLPLGWRVVQKVTRIVREEMDRSGALEAFLPVVQPSRLWEESGRWSEYGPELMRVKDRHQAEFALGPTHEEVITELVRRDVSSYKQLPMNLYQIQTKFRDEIRPRFGVMRAREFIMKDAYSFHIDDGSLSETYDAMHTTYNRIFTRLGLDFRAVQADSGAIGGSVSHEFQVLAESGEDAIAVSDSGPFAANIEFAEALPPHDPSPAAPSDGDQAIESVETPGATSIEEVAALLDVPTHNILKGVLVEGASDDHPVVALFLRGDHDLNEVKAGKLDLVKSPLTLANAATLASSGLPAGYVGPVDLPPDVPVVVDASATPLCDFVCGANQEGRHYRHVHWGRDCPMPAAVADLRNVVDGDPSPDGVGRLSIVRGIEVGHIFQLGRKYSEPMGATVLDENGKAVTLAMGCYGIGITRVVAAAIEQHHDEKGTMWPEAIAPFQVGIVPINYAKSAAVREEADRLMQALVDEGYEVLLDDRKERPGVMFADMDLIGIPHRITIGEKGLQADAVTYRQRAEEEGRKVPTGEMVHFLRTTSPPVR